MKVTRVFFADEASADALADSLFEAGHEVAVVKEQDEDELSWVVATTADAEVVRELTSPEAIILSE